MFCVNVHQDELSCSVADWGAASGVACPEREFVLFVKVFLCLKIRKKRIEKLNSNIFCQRRIKVNLKKKSANTTWSWPLKPNTPNWSSALKTAIQCKQPHQQCLSAWEKDKQWMSEEQLHPQINVAVRRWSCLPWSCNMELWPSVCEAQLWKNKHPTRLFTLLFTWFSFSLKHIYIYDSWQQQIKFLLFLSVQSVAHHAWKKWKEEGSEVQLYTLLSSCVKRDIDRILSHKSHSLLAWQPQSPTALLSPLFSTSSKRGICSAAMSSSAVAAFGFLLLLLPLQGIVHLLCPCVSQSFGLVPVPPVEI